MLSLMAHKFERYSYFGRFFSLFFSLCIMEIFVQRLASESFDKKKEGCKFLRMKSASPGLTVDPPADSPSPHIVAILVDK